MTPDLSADEGGLVGPDRVRTVIQGVLRGAQAAGWTDEALEAASGVKARRIKSYRVEGKEPSLSAALSIALVLGQRGLNPILALIGYCGEPLEDADGLAPAILVAECIKDVSIIAEIAAAGINHQTTPRLQQACDDLIQRAVPFSSAGRAV